MEIFRKAAFSPMCWYRRKPSQAAELFIVLNAAPEAISSPLPEDAGIQELGSN